jgi:hypothetical protein
MSDAPSLDSFGNQPPAAVVALAESLRGLTETMLRIPALPPDVEAEVSRTGDAIDALTARLAPHALGDAVPRMGPEPATTRPFYVTGVMMGEHHPLRPDVSMEHQDGVTRGRVRFGVTFEGPPGCVHGGFVAHFFDQILGQHNLFARIPAMTGTLSVRYRQGTPILRDLTFEVRHAPEGERKVRTTSRLEADGEVFSEAEGVFIVPRTLTGAEAERG